MGSGLVCDGGVMRDAGGLTPCSKTAQAAWASAWMWTAVTASFACWILERKPPAALALVLATLPLAALPIFFFAILCRREVREFANALYVIGIASVVVASLVLVVLLGAGIFIIWFFGTPLLAAAILMAAILVFGVGMCKGAADLRGEAAWRAWHTAHRPDLARCMPPYPYAKSVKPGQRPSHTASLVLGIIAIDIGLMHTYDGLAFGASAGIAFGAAGMALALRARQRCRVSGGMACSIAGIAIGMCLALYLMAASAYLPWLET